MALYRYVGIDVGLNGGIAYVDSDGGYQVHDMPVYYQSTKRKTDIPMIVRILEDMKIGPDKRFCYIERQQPFHQQGIVSTFSLGEQFGVFKGILSALGYPYNDIPAKLWQKEFAIAEKTKEASYKVASSLFPYSSLKTDRGRILDGRSDAILLAEFCRRRFKHAHE